MPLSISITLHTSTKSTKCKEIVLIAVLVIFISTYDWIGPKAKQDLVPYRNTLNRAIYLLVAFIGRNPQHPGIHNIISQYFAFLIYLENVCVCVCVSICLSVYHLSSLFRRDIGWPILLSQCYIAKTIWLRKNDRPEISQQGFKCSCHYRFKSLAGFEKQRKVQPG